MKTYILKTDENGYFVNDTKIVEDSEIMRKLFAKDALSVLRHLAKKPSSSESDIAKYTKLSKKSVSKLLGFLTKAGLVAVHDANTKKGPVYLNASSSFAFELADAKIKLNIKEKGVGDENTAKFFRRFVKDGKFDGYICVGSPDPHGEYKSIARDTHYALYLAMFLGQFCELPKNFPIVLDTDVIARNLFKENLIVVGGPVTNLITRDINTFLPIKFAKDEGWGLKDKGEVHNRDYEGTIEKIKNPFDKTKEIIMFGGIRNIGTLSAILAGTRFSKLTFRTYTDSLPWSVMVRGYDIDGDGEIDSVETVR